MVREEISRPLFRVFAGHETKRKLTAELKTKEREKQAMGIVFSSYDEPSWHDGPFGWKVSSPSDPRFDMTGESTRAYNREAEALAALKAKAYDLGVETPLDFVVELM